MPSHLSRRGVYPLIDPDEEAIEAKHGELLRPLTLLSDDDSPRDGPLETARALSPLTESVSRIPTSLAELSNLVRQRICPDPNLAYPLSEQQALAVVILGELSVVWRKLRTLPSHSSFDDKGNQELLRRVFVYVVAACQTAFQFYRAKLSTIGKGIITQTANVSRVRGALAVHLHELLDIDRARRHIADELLHPPPEDARVDELPSQRLTFQSVLRLSKPKRQLTHTVADREIKRMLKAMPRLNIDAVIKALPSQLTDGYHPGEGLSLRPVVSSARELSSNASLPITPRNDEKRHRLQRSASQPELREDIDDITRVEIKQSLLDACNNRLSSIKKVPIENKETELTPEGDLKKLATYIPLKDVTENIPEDEELPPLLQATTASKRGQRLSKLKQKLSEAEKKSREVFHEISSQHLSNEGNDTDSNSLIPQPATIHTRLPNAMLARTNDVRVSDRVAMSELTLSSFPPMCTHLSGPDALSSKEVQQMDAQLHYLDELRGLYSQLATSNDHLLHDCDDIVEPCAANIDLAALTTSAGLFQSRRVINKDLTGYHKEYNVPPNAKFGKQVATMEEAAKDQASWLAFWRSLLTHDDYLKYLSAHESDYLAVIFHFYDSDNDELQAVDDEKLGGSTAGKSELREETVEWTPGEWSMDASIPVSSKDASLQKRLEAVWQSLHVPNNERLNMALKYSSGHSFEKLHSAIETWEVCCRFITKREEILARLETFERLASRPERLFESRDANAESRDRLALETELSTVSAKVDKYASFLEQNYGDTVTFRGRRYLDKMLRDKVELLYWLQQERREYGLQRGRLLPLAAIKS